GHRGCREEADQGEGDGRGKHERQANQQQTAPAGEPEGGVGAEVCGLRCKLGGHGATFPIFDLFRLVSIIEPLCSNVYSNASSTVLALVIDYCRDSVEQMFEILPRLA